MRRRLCLAITCLTFIAGCGGGAAPVATTTAPATTTTAPASTTSTSAVTTDAALPAFDPELDAALHRAATAALDLFDDLGTAGVAILLAYQSGHSFQEIAAALASGRLTDQGTIHGTGAPEASRGPVAVLAAFHPAPRSGPLHDAADLELVRDELRRRGETWDDEARNVFLYYLLGGISLGMDAGQLIEAIVLGELIPTVQRAQCLAGTNDDRVYADCIAAVDAVFGPAAGATGTETTTTTTALVEAATDFEATGGFQAPDPGDLPFPYEVTENQIHLVVEAGDVQIPTLVFSSISVPWSGFELGSGETTEPPCSQHSDTTLEGFQGSYDPATGALTGTGVLTQHTIDIGTDCPFGGIDRTDLRPFELEATLTGGTLTGGFRYTESEGTLTFEATVDTG
ncbi:MAG: hypothetical protein KQH83_10095 [Actinobacteria bacterium]|nr:hypothetical protein [Actinomycetota bacterium]